VKARVEDIRITAGTDITVLLTFSRRVAVGASPTLQLLSVEKGKALMLETRTRQAKSTYFI
jgi:hypothetical protein